MLSAKSMIDLMAHVLHMYDCACRHARLHRDCNDSALPSDSLLSQQRITGYFELLPW